MIGAVAAAGFGHRAYVHWRAARQAGQPPQSAPAAVRALGPARPLPWAAAPNERREPQFAVAPTPRRAAAAPAAAEPEPAASRLVRLVMPGTRSLASGKRAENERQATLDLAPPTVSRSCRRSTC